MGVDQAGRDEAVGGVQGRYPRRLRDRSTQLDDLAVANQHVARLGASLSPDQLATTDKQVRRNPAHAGALIARSANPPVRSGSTLDSQALADVVGARDFPAAGPDQIDRAADELGV